MVWEMCDLHDSVIVHSFRYLQTLHAFVKFVRNHESWPCGCKNWFLDLKSERNEIGERTFPHAISNRCVVDNNKIILILPFAWKFFCLVHRILLVKYLIPVKNVADYTWVYCYMFIWVNLCLYLSSLIKPVRYPAADWMRY